MPLSEIYALIETIKEQKKQEKEGLKNPSTTSTDKLPPTPSTIDSITRNVSINIPKK